MADTTALLPPAAPIPHVWKSWWWQQRQSAARRGVVVVVAFELAVAGAVRVMDEAYGRHDAAPAVKQQRAMRQNSKSGSVSWCTTAGHRKPHWRHSLHGRHGEPVLSQTVWGLHTHTFTLAEAAIDAEYHTYTLTLDVLVVPQFAAATVRSIAS